MMFLLIVTLTSMLLAAIMSAIAWRVAGDDRRRSEARIAALSAEIDDASPVSATIVAQTGAVGRANRAGSSWDADLELQPAGRSGNAAGQPFSDAPKSRGQKGPAHTDLFAYADLFATRQAPSGARRVAVLAGVALVFGAVGVFAIAGGAARRAPRTAGAVAVAAPAASPLELVALGHEHVGDQLTVRGVVRNPASGAGMNRLTAVVLLFTADGGFIATGRAVVASPALQPGGESAFVVTVPAAGEVGRYRVSFRTDDRIVPHLDRRHEG